MTAPRTAALALCALLGTAALAQQGRPGPGATAEPRSSSAASAPAAPAAGTADVEQAGRLAAQGWLGLLDRQDWGTAWETSAAMFRESVPLPAWMDGIPKTRQPMGRLVDRQATETVYQTQLEGFPPGHYVTVIFASKFDQRQVDELLTTVREPDGRWRVTGYSTR